jgi:DNA helicase-2/ATP-dependent DNA helicase PcrA
MFVGITRAKQELQISRAVYRDFRGQRRMPVPSRFLLELPREDMENVSHEDDVACWDAVPEPLADRADGGAWEPERPSEPAGAVAAPRGKVRRASLVTAAELTGGRQPARVSPDDFTQGMVVRDPHNGLGHVVALTGSGEHRTATVDFVSPPCRVKFVLAQSRLQPLRPARPENP